MYLSAHLRLVVDAVLLAEHRLARLAAGSKVALAVVLHHFQHPVGLTLAGGEPHAAVVAQLVLGQCLAPHTGLNHPLLRDDAALEEVVCLQPRLRFGKCDGQQ